MGLSIEAQWIGMVSMAWTSKGGNFPRANLRQTRLGSGRL